MTKVPATEFKARCLELMDRVAERRETYVITKHGKPVAKLVPVERKPDEPLFGRLRHMVDEVGDILGPAVALEAWETLKGDAPPVSGSAGKRRPARKKHR